MVDILRSAKDAVPMGNSFSAAVAARVRGALGVAQVSGAELARRMGVSPTYVWRRLNGETAFDTDELERVAAAIKVDLAELLPVPERAA